MAKPFRVKRAGKYIGSWLVWVDGERVNLDTKDANEARRRARLVELGKWPPGESVAKQTKKVLDGQGDSDDDDPGDEGSQYVEGGLPVISAPAAREATPAPTVPPVPPSVPESVPPVDPVAAANQAAADFSGELKEALSGAGTSISDVVADLPDMLAGAHLWLQGQGCRVVVRYWKKRWPSMVTLDESDKIRKLMGKMWTEQLKRWEIAPESMSPLEIIAICTVVTSLQQIGAMTDEVQALESAETGAPKVA
jgi:hypothetical protein